MQIVIIFLFLCLSLALAVWVARDYHRLKDVNQCPLRICTFDGSNSPYHPSVLFFAEGWNGYRYWMAETPFAPVIRTTYRDRNECPSIHVSNDGIHWTEPEGLHNPLVNFGAEGERNLDYYSDPHLVMVGERMECWYRLTERHGDMNNHSHISLRKISSTDGVHWSLEILLNQLNENSPRKGLGISLFSPATIYEKGTYTIWYVCPDSERQSTFCVMTAHSVDGFGWSDAKPCVLSDCRQNIWHLDVQHFDNVYWLVAYDRDSALTLYSSIDGLHFDFVRTLLTPSRVAGSFYCRGLYRACLVRTDSDYRLYFTAEETYKSHIGLMAGPSPRELKVVSVETDRVYSSFTDYCLALWNNKMQSCIFILRHLFKGRKIHD